MWEPSRAWLSDPILVVLYALAVYRLTRLLVADKLLEPVRHRLASNAEGRLAYFVTCPWCVSMWVAGAWLLLATLLPPIAWFAGALLAFSAIAGLLAGRE